MRTHECPFSPSSQRMVFTRVPHSKNCLTALRLAWPRSTRAEARTHDRIHWLCKTALLISGEMLKACEGGLPVGKRENLWGKRK